MNGLQQKKNQAGAVCSGKYCVFEGQEGLFPDPGLRKIKLPVRWQGQCCT